MEEKNAEIIQNAIDGSLSVIDQDREKQIVARRFGLSGRKETLEEIGEGLSITRERVRQLEKAIIIRLQIAAEDGLIPSINQAEKLIIRNLTEMGRIARIPDLAKKLFGREGTPEENARLYFIATFAQSLAVVEENGMFFLSIGIAEYGNSRDYRARADEIVRTIKVHRKPMALEELDEKLNYEHPSHIAAIASISRQLSSLNGSWGLVSWPVVNPRNIRDKIYVVLKTHGQWMHFEDIAKAIADSDFNHKEVTTQAIHNELIKDPRFILIGRGCYALSEWGYKKGTVYEVITDILKEAGTPLDRKDIVKQVLKVRRVKETTVLLNLQDKKHFKRIGKTHYDLI